MFASVANATDNPSRYLYRVLPKKLETGNWKLETGNWKLETGNWKLETKKGQPLAETDLFC
ncbi:hypothetical protein BWI97_07935 [Siphonobacter sp. BAB-5405]|nr:hypothetical protein BWI97_07935 [Siphonobacter sp. BAB-5405]